MAAPFLACMAAVASFYRLPAGALPAIQAVEGGRIGSVHRNRDGTDDLGPMQINTRWLPPLSRFTGLPVARLRGQLLRNGCFNVAVGGAILRIALDETRGDLGRAVGDYHSHTLALNEAYWQRVLRAGPLEKAGDLPR